MPRSSSRRPSSSLASWLLAAPATMPARRQGNTVPVQDRTHGAGSEHVHLTGQDVGGIHRNHPEFQLRPLQVFRVHVGAVDRGAVIAQVAGQVIPHMPEALYRDADPRQ